MTIEQSADLNQFLRSHRPCTWPNRWRIFQAILPLHLFTVVLTGESIAMSFWLHGKSVWVGFLTVATFALFLTGMMAVVTEISLRSSRWEKRKLQLMENWIALGQARIRWNLVESWQLDPVPEKPGLRELTLKYFLGHKRKIRRERSIILEHPGQTGQLKSKLTDLHQAGAGNATLTESSLPPVKSPQAGKFRILPVLVTTVGLLCFMHGMFFLGAGLADGRTEPTETAPHPKMEHFVRQHFANVKQLRVFFFSTGGVFIGLGAGFHTLSLAMLRRKSQFEKEVGAT